MVDAKETFCTYMDDGIIEVIVIRKGDIAERDAIYNAIKLLEHY